MKYPILILLILLVVPSLGQPNCNYFRLINDKTKHKACVKAEKRLGHYQFSRKYQSALDESLEIDATFAFAYRAKSTAYLKSGDFITWKFLIDKAVQYAPEEYLGYRAWCRFQFFRDYQGCIDDIEMLESQIDYNIGYSVNGDFHLTVAKAICLWQIEKRKEAINLIENHVEDSKNVGLFDYLYLGIYHFKNGNINKAKTYLKQQQTINDLAEIHFYLGLISELENEENEAIIFYNQAKSLYLQSRYLDNRYVIYPERIYLEDITSKINLHSNQE